MNSEKLVLTFVGAQGEVLAERKLNGVPLREDAVLRLSLEFYGDPEPCMLHRSAVMNRMYMELLEYLLSYVNKGVCLHPAGTLPERLASFLNVPGFSEIRVSRDSPLK